MDMNIVYWREEVSQFDTLLAAADEIQAQNLLRGILWLATGVQKTSPGHSEEILKDLRACLVKLQTRMGPHWVSRHAVLVNSHASAAQVAALVAQFLGEP